MNKLAVFKLIGEKLKKYIIFLVLVSKLSFAEVFDIFIPNTVKISENKTQIKLVKLKNNQVFLGKKSSNFEILGCKLIEGGQICKVSGDFEFNSELKYNLILISKEVGIYRALGLSSTDFINTINLKLGKRL